MTIGIIVLMAITMVVVGIRIDEYRVTRPITDAQRARLNAAFDRGVHLGGLQRAHNATGTPEQILLPPGEGESGSPNRT